jgi:hypothetical protein
MKFPELLPPASKAHLLRSAVVSCSEASDKKCDIVLVPDGNLQTGAAMMQWTQLRRQTRSADQ